MTNVNPRFVLTILLGPALGLALTCARADVKVQSLTYFSGVVGVGASDITDTSYLQGHNQRVESNLKFTGAVLGTMQKWMSHGDNSGNTVIIYRVDENRKLTVDADNKSYREQPIFTPPQPVQENPSASATSNPGQQQESDVRVVKNEFNVKETGKTQTINGFKTQEYLVTWNLETENTKTHEHARSRMTTELWNSEDARFTAARKEQAAYNQAYAKLMHKPMSADMTKQFGLMQLNYLNDKDMQPFVDQLNKIKGFPVVTDVKWEAGCIANCARDDQTQSQDEQSSGSSGGLSGLLSGLMSKDSKQNSSAGQPSKSSDGLTTIFQSHTEVQSIDTGSQPASLFEAPSGYTQH